MPGKISDKQQQILDYIKEEILKKGYPPTVREICEKVGLSSTSYVHSHLNTLEENGYIREIHLKLELLRLLMMMNLLFQEERFRTFQLWDVSQQVNHYSL